VHIILLFALCVGSIIRANAQVQIKRLDGTSLSTIEIDQTMTRLMKVGEVTGAAIDILNDGKVVYTKAYGFRDQQKSLQLTTGSVMAGASFTKAAFAYFVMQLVNDGTLDLDKPIYQYLPKPLPEYPRYADLAGDTRCQKITARMLLSHTAGFPNWRGFE